MIVAKKNKGKASTSQLLTFMRDSYLDRTSRPIYALAYLLVFIAIYEIGTAFISSEALGQSMGQDGGRVVSFLWLQGALESIGFSHPKMAWIAPPIAVIVILLALQIASRTSWSIRLGDFLPMTIECILLAIPLIVLGLALNRSIGSHANVAQASSSVRVEVTTLSSVSGEDARSPVVSMQNGSVKGGTTQSSSFFVNVISGIGAGIYEELVFRLILICLLMILFQDLMGLGTVVSIVTSIIISAVLFSAHHHWFFLNGSFQTADDFKFTTFIFRLLAGVYFAVVFAVRGFGISAGAHAFYDIIVAIINAVFMAPSE